MIILLRGRIYILIFSLTIIFSQHSHSQSIEDLQLEFTELRFGAFFHYGIRTYTGGQWAQANQDIDKFNPSDLDCAQWADVLVSTGMKFGILTTKHHDGFCLWNSRYTDFDVASIPWRNGTGDVVREYVDAFRARGLLPCLYYSIWDNTAGIGNGEITPFGMEVIKGQLTELLTNYGEIKMMFIDGWSWKMGHKEVPYDEIRTHVKELQPNCLLVDNTHLRCLYHNDLIHFEDGSPCPPDNTLPAVLSKLIYKNSGNGWFWDSRIPDAELMSVSEIVNENLNYLEPRWCTFILNLPPNPDGKLDKRIVSRLAEVGEKWSPDLNRIPLPTQDPFIDITITPQSATATSGNPYYAIDGKNDRYYYSVWETSESFPQTITINLGEVYYNINILSYVPKYKTVIVPLTEGSIKKFKIYKSLDGNKFSEIISGEWNGDYNMKVVTFQPTSAKYIRMEILSAENGFAAATEITLGKTNSVIGVIENRGENIFK